MNKLLFGVGVSVLGLVARAIEPETGADGNYIFTVASGEETYPGVLSGTGDVVKRGDGKLTLTGVNTLTGTYRVEQGTLQMSANAHPGTGTAKPSLVVAAGATFVSDGPDSAKQWSNIPFKAMTLAGAGVGGQGAFVRQNDAVGLRGDLKVTLAGDTTINVKSVWNPGALHLNGHKLTKIGAGRLDGYDKVFTADGDGGKGSVCIAEGSYLNQVHYNLSGGSAANVLELLGGAQYDLYTRAADSAPSEWTLKVAGAAKIASHDTTGSVVWNGPLQAAGGVLTLMGDVEAGLETLAFKGPATIGDVTIGTSAVAAEFQGETSLTGTVFAGNGTLRLKGCKNAVLTGVIGNNESKNHVSRYELADVGYARHTANVYLNGKESETTPTVFCLTNSVWDGQSTEFIVCANYCRSVLDLCDSVFTNATWLGGRWSSQYAGIGALYQRGGSFYGPLYLNAQPGNAAYVKESGFFDNAGEDLQIGGNGFGAVHLLAGDNAVRASLKMESHGDYSQNGGTVYYQAGGSNTVYMISQSAQKAGCESVLALEGSTTVLQSTDWSQFTMKVDPSLAFTAVSAINGGARLASGRFARDQKWPKTEGGQAKWYLSFDGGIVHQLYQGDWFDSTNRAPDKVIVQEGGVSVDTTGCKAEAFFSLPFEAPVGQIVDSIDLPTDEAFANEVYLTPVKVEIHGVGAGAAAIAILDKERRTIKEIKVVARGTGYDSTTTATLEAAAHKNDSKLQVKYDCKVNLAKAPTTGAGFRKLGAGLFDLRTANTFKGPVTVQEGTVRFRVAQSLPADSGLAVGDGATADFAEGYGASDEPVSVPTLEVTGAARVTGLPKQGLRVTEELKVNAEIDKRARVDGPLVLADGVTITGIDVGGLNPERKNVILEADKAGGITCEGGVTLPEVPEGWRAYISGRRLCVSRERGVVVIIK